VQRPLDLDTAFSLALLQEEANATHRHEYQRSDPPLKSRSNRAQVPLPLPLPPKTDKSVVAGQSANSCGSDGVRAVVPDDKVIVLCAYRRARRLCQFCVEKWYHGHECASSIPLQATQELWEMLQVDMDSKADSDSSKTEAQFDMLLSQEAVSLGGKSRPLTFLAQFRAKRWSSW
jgi:hypothetical protein